MQGVWLFACGLTCIYQINAIRHFECKCVQFCMVVDMQWNCDFLSHYFCDLTGEAKKCYDDKLKLIGYAQDLYYRLENSKAKVDSVLEWNDWPDVSSADIYNYLVLAPVSILMSN